MRKTYEESIDELAQRGVIRRGTAPSSPPAARPRHDDEGRGLSFFRTLVEDASFADLTVPGMFVGHSEVARVSFRNCDLRRSTLCWNDFVDVDFTGACLAECDLRGSIYSGCRFDGADLTGALVGRKQTIDLSEEQRGTVEWRDDEPPGG